MLNVHSNDMIDGGKWQNQIKYFKVKVQIDLT